MSNTKTAPSEPEVSQELRAEIRFRALEMALHNGHSLANEPALLEAVDKYSAIVLDEVAVDEPVEADLSSEDDQQSGNQKGGK